MTNLEGGIKDVFEFFGMGGWADGGVLNWNNDYWRLGEG